MLLPLRQHRMPCSILVLPMALLTSPIGFASYIGEAKLDGDDLVDFLDEQATLMGGRYAHYAHIE